LCFFRSQIERFYYQWKIEHLKNQNKKQKREFQGQLSNYAMSLSIINDLAKFDEEKKIIKRIADLFMMLFAPKQIIYQPNDFEDKSQLIYFGSKEEYILPKKGRSKRCHTLSGGSVFNSYFLRR
jgi:phosphopantothenoylcysteine synthetase/decarboxylase